MHVVLVLRCAAIYHLDILAEVPLEAAKQDLPLAGLEAIQHGGNGALKVSPRKQYQLLQQFGRAGSCLQRDLWLQLTIAGQSRCQLEM